VLLNHELEEMRHMVLEEFDHWAPQLADGRVQGFVIDVIGYRRLEERVRSQGKREPQHADKLTRVK